MGHLDRTIGQMSKQFVPLDYSSANKGSTSHNMRWFFLYSRGTKENGVAFYFSCFNKYYYSRCVYPAIISNLNLKRQLVIVYPVIPNLDPYYVSIFDRNHSPLGPYASASYLVSIRRSDPCDCVRYNVLGGRSSHVQLPRDKKYHSPMQRKNIYLVM